ncbi:MAG: hypothetical protein F4X98_15225 [Gammaproteobacteria bacterium]|nr:hypothetical protein [Gammaproteobacteria bacterium]
MSSRLSELCFDDDLPEAERVAAEAGWRIGRTGETAVEVSMQSTVDDERYFLRLVWSEYPDEAPSIVCFDPETGRPDVQSAWPDCDGFRPGQPDLCLPLSAEGFAAHPEWGTDPVKRWSTDGNVLLRVLDELQVILNSRSHYRGRTPCQH